MCAVGISETDGELVVEVRKDARLPAQYPLAKFFRADRSVEALVGGEGLTIAAGERVEMNHSYKYAAETFPRILTDAGLTVRWRGTSDDARFQMILAAA